MMKDYIEQTEYVRRMEEQVMPFLNACRQDGTFESWDGNPIHYAFFRAKEEKGVLVISHGFTDSCEKFHELTWYFLKAGLSVYIPEHRGHGLSYRALPDLTLTHIDHFEEYADDFAMLMTKVVLPEHPGPFYLFAHSMGGAIGTLYMERFPDVFQKAVLTSPMIAPSTGSVPLFLAKAIFGCLCLFGSGRKRSFTSQPYPGKELFEDGFKTSRERFAEYEALKSSTPHLQNYSPTCRWVYESLGVKSKVLKKGEPEKIETEVLIFSTEGDTLVLPEAQKALADRLKKGRLVTVKNAKHELYGSEDAVLKPYLEEIFAFFGLENE